MTDDGELLRRYVDDNSEEAFRELVQRRIGLVFAIIGIRSSSAHRIRAARRSGRARRGVAIQLDGFVAMLLAMTDAGIPACEKLPRNSRG